MVDHKSLSEALAAAQAEYPPIIKGSMNPHFGKPYADLADGMEPVRPILAKHGIAYTQTFHVVDGTLLLRTKLRWQTEEEVSELPIAQPPKPQDFVALTTYYRRVGLFSIAGITPSEEDDDGNAVNNVATTQAPPRRRQSQARKQPELQADPWALSETPRNELVKTMVTFIELQPWPDVQAALSAYDGHFDLSMGEAGAIIAATKARKAKEAERRRAETPVTEAG